MNWTLSALCALTLHAHAGDTVTVRAHLDCFKLEKDGDVHLVLSDSGHTMIAEIVPGTLPFHATKRWKRVDTMVTVTGLVRYDHEHGQRGAARNGVEIHPVLSIQ